ncbi:MAG: tRNA 2-thiouridine(34) synthase MnmA [Gammaproteobacteria bacterium]
MSKESVIVGMSGGVDSSVAALMLLKQGYAVQGLFMDNWEDDKEETYCNAAEDFQDARRVCETLGISLHKVNFAQEYRERVFAYFLEEFEKGRTPNPDVLCNSEIKFKAFLSHAQRLGADRIATGHYARVEGSHLLKSIDQNKDQTYFLHAVQASALERTLFPLGELEKDAVREYAREAGFENFDKKDSTGICFIGERKFREFLSNYLPAKPGPMQTVDGKAIGEHMGLMYYTIGQRRGLGIGGRKNADDGAWFVVNKRMQDNVLIVAQGHEHPSLQNDGLKASVLHWINRRPDIHRPLHAKTRYRQPDQQCSIRKLDDKHCDVIFKVPQRAITPGQYVVLYDGEECLGGGIIDRGYNASDTAINGAA